MLDESLKVNEIRDWLRTSNEILSIVLNYDYIEDEFKI